MSNHLKLFVCLVVFVFIFGFLFFPKIGHPVTTTEEELAMCFLVKYVEISEINDDRFIINNVEFFIAGNRDYVPRKVVPYILGYLKEKDLKYFFLISPDKNGQFPDEVLAFMSEFRKRRIDESIDLLFLLKKSMIRGKILVIKQNKE